MAVSLRRGELDWQLGTVAIETTGDRTLSGVFSPDRTRTGNGVITVEATDGADLGYKNVLTLKMPQAADEAVLLYSARDINAAESQNDDVGEADDYYAVHRVLWRGVDTTPPGSGRIAFFRLLGDVAATTNIATIGVRWESSISGWQIFAAFPTTGQNTGGAEAVGSTQIPVGEYFDLKLVWRRGVGVYVYTKLQGDSDWTLEVSRVNADVNKQVSRWQYMISDVAGSWTGTPNAEVEFHRSAWSTASESEAEEAFIDQKMGLVFASKVGGKVTFQLTQNPDAYQNASKASLSYFAVEYADNASFTSSTTTAWTLLPNLAAQHTARVDVTGLTEDSTLYYRWLLRSTGTGSAEFTGDTRSLLVPPGPSSSVSPRIWMTSCHDGAGQISYKPQLGYGLDLLDATPYHLGVFLDDVWYGWGMNAEDDGKFTPESVDEKFVRAVEAWQNRYSCRVWHKLAFLTQYGDHDAYWNDADLTDRETASGNLNDLGLAFTDSGSTITPAQVAANGRTVWDALMGTAMRANFHESGVDYGTGVFGNTRIILTDSWGFRRESTNTGWGATQVAWFKGVVDAATEPLVLCVDASIWGRIGAQGSSLIRIASAEHQDVIDYVEANALTRYIGVGGDSHIGPTAHRRIALSTGDAIASTSKTRGWCGFFVVSPLDQKNNAALNSGTNEACYAASTGSALREGVDAAYLYREDGFAKPATDPVGGASLDAERGQIRTSGYFFTTNGGTVRMTAYGNADNALLADVTYTGQPFSPLSKGNLSGVIGQPLRGRL